MNQLREKGMTVEGIAQALGVSKTTVSRALSGKGRVSEETKLRIRNFIDRGGNAGPEQRPTNTLTVVIPQRFIEMGLPFVYACVRGIGYAAKLRNYDVLLCTADEKEQAQLERHLEQRKSDGVILFRTVNGEDPCLEAVRRYNKPCVVLGRFDDDRILQVDSANFEAAREMTRLLLRMGLRRIAYVYDDINATINLDRLQGFTRALKDAGIPVDQNMIYSDLMTEPQRLDALESIMRQQPDCILCCDDRLALYIFELMRQQEIRCPDQIRLASLYDSQFLQWASITAVQFDSEALGACACRALLDSIAHKEVALRQVQPYQIILRESTK